MKRFSKPLKVLTGCILVLCTLVVTVWAAPTGNCPGGCAHPAAIGSIHYDTLAEAVSASKSGDTVTLLTDVALTAPLRITTPIVLDLGGKTLTANLPAGQAAVSFTADGTVRNGGITAGAGSALQVSDCSVTIEKDTVLCSSGTEPTLGITAGKEMTTRVNLSGQVQGDGVVIDVASQEGICELYVLEDAVITAKAYPAITFDSAGKLDISGGTIQSEADVIWVTIRKDRVTELSITDGFILSKDRETILLLCMEDAQVPAGFITGGTYRKLPRAYIPADCRIQENPDGTYTVISAYTLTFLANGGTGTMEPLKVPCGSTVTLPACGITAPTGRDFAGWELNGTLYAPGDTYLPTGDVTLKALWKLHTHTGGTATCLSKAVCDVCSQVYGDYAPHQLTHSGGYAATCTATGMNSHSVCTVCGKYFASGVVISSSALTIPALGHNWESVEAIPATCTEDGQKAFRKCSRCGALQADGAAVAEEDLRIPASGHALEKVPAVQATCQTTGMLAHERCTVCDSLFQDGTPVTQTQLTTALASHVLSDWQYDEHYHWKTCVDCGEVFRQNGHTDDDRDRRCDDCGWEMPASEASVEDRTDSSLLLLLPVFLIAMAVAAAAAAYLLLKKRKN